MKTWRRAESSVKRHFFFRYLALLPCTCRCCCTKSQKFARALFLPLHVRRAHGAFVRPHVFTVAILAQGTNRGDALCAALLLRRVGSNPTANTFFPILVILCKTANAYDLRERYDAGIRKKSRVTSGVPMERLCVRMSSP